MVVRFSATHPEAEVRAKSIISIAPPIFDNKINLNIFKLPESILWLIRPILSARARELILGPHADLSLMKQESALSSTNPVHMFRSYYLGIDPKLFNIENLNRKLKIKILFISANYDKICPHEGVLKWSNHFQTQVARLENCGHQCMQEDPKQVNETIKQFLDQI